MLKNSPADESTVERNLKALCLALVRRGLKDGKGLAASLADSCGWQGEKGEILNISIVRTELMDDTRKAFDDLCLFQDLDIRIVTYLSEEYPRLLKAIHEPPPILFYRGALEKLAGHSCIAVVGSRRADIHGCRFSEDVSEKLAACGVCIVSGLAYGIDAAAHRGALKHTFTDRIQTIAVLGSGLNCIYPAAHTDLAHMIVEKGGILLSQFEPDEKPFPSNFLNRNRVISGICLGTVVVQATEKSGSLATARHALEEGRDVMVVPGDIDDPRFVGSNRLIKQGANLITCAEDIMSLIGTDPSSPCINPFSPKDLSSYQQRILEILTEEGPLHEDKLRGRLGTGESFFEEILSLEFDGLVERRTGNVVAARK